VHDAATVQLRQQAQGLAVISGIAGLHLLHGLAGDVAAQQLIAIPTEQARHTVDAIQFRQRTGFARSGVTREGTRPPTGGADITADDAYAIALDDLDAPELIRFQ
jgi:hypothetical protein